MSTATAAATRPLTCPDPDCTGTVQGATFTLVELNGRERAVLRAVAAGRCSLCGPSARSGRGTLTVDGLNLADQFTGPRLVAAGLIEAAPAGDGAALPLRLTGTGRALLAA